MFSIIKKITVLSCIVLFVSCNANKSIIQTKRNGTTPGYSHNTNKSDKTNGKPSDKETQTLEATTKVKVTNEMILAYIDQFKDVAKKNMTQFNIPCSIILAQGILESGAGTGPLCTQANNHFGIKCHKEWTGPSINHDDDTAQECFRKYEQAVESYNDHSQFLISRPRYANLFKLEKGDYKAWATGLKAAGYATDEKYPDKLVGIIERFKLYQYDTEVLGIDVTQNSVPNIAITKQEGNVVVDNTTQIQEKETATSNTAETSDKKTYEVVKGDTLYSVSKKFSISIEDLKAKNNIIENAISIGQKLIVE